MLGRELWLLRPLLTCLLNKQIDVGQGQQRWQILCERWWVSKQLVIMEVKAAWQKSFRQLTVFLVLGLDNGGWLEAGQRLKMVVYTSSSWSAQVLRIQLEITSGVGAFLALNLFRVALTWFWCSWMEASSAGGVFWGMGGAEHYICVARSLKSELKC